MDALPWGAVTSSSVRGIHEKARRCDGDSPSRLLVGLVRAMPQLEEDPEMKNAIFE